MVSIVALLTGWLVVVGSAAPRSPDLSLSAGAGHTTTSVLTVTNPKTGGLADDEERSERPKAPRSEGPTVAGPKTGAPRGDGQAAGEQRPEPIDRVTYDRRRDLSIMVLAGSGWIVSDLLKTHLAATTCRWCDEPLNGFDAWGRRTFRWQNTGSAATLSSVMGFFAAPVAAYGLDYVVAHHDDRSSEVPANAVLITQAVMLAADATQLIKFATGRARPYLHPPIPPEAPTLSPADNNTSFPSGHTTIAFSVVTASAEIAALRGYDQAAWIWRAGMPLATLTAYLRVAADRHYLTDVLMGAGVGSAVGFAVPYLGHRRRDSRVPGVRVTPAPGGGSMIAVEWAW